MPTPEVSEYSDFDHQRLLVTMDRLCRRVGRDFEGRGIARVANELRGKVQPVQDATEVAFRAVLRARAAAWFLIALVVIAELVALGFTYSDVVSGAGPTRSFDWAPLLESTINLVVFAGVAVYFLLLHLPERLQRTRLLEQLYGLRTLAHIIHMHQLSKDHSDPPMTRSEYVAYADYCSEMLALAGKAATLISKHTSDPTVLETVGSVELLANELSSLALQKADRRA
jgi:hypothetical protein